MLHHHRPSQFRHLTFFNQIFKSTPLQKCAVQVVKRPTGFSDREQIKTTNMPLSQLVTQPADRFATGATILLKLLDNVIRDPINAKYRTIRLANRTIADKLLAVPGMMDCLIGIGFKRTDDELQLPSTVLIAQLKKHRDALNDLLTSPVPISSGAISKPRISTAAVYDYRPYEERCSFAQVISSSNPFLRLLEQQSDEVMQYEDVQLQAYARSLIPIHTLSEQAILKMRQCQKQINADHSETTDKLTEPCFRDALLIELTDWFHGKFFTWVNQPPCPACGNAKPQPTGSTVASGEQVELYACACGQSIRFVRHNDVAKLLRSRRGRCGEYANCFTFLCRSLGFEARKVHATFDHVWTEVWSLAQQRWIHVDPSDAVVDAPLMYQHGWKRPVDYVLAVSAFDVQDVTHRYNNDHAELPKRRKRCDEAELLKVIEQLRAKRQASCSKVRRRLLAKRTLFELAGLMTPKAVSVDELKGRSSGSMSWRTTRGERQQSGSQFYVFTALPAERHSHTFNVRFSMARNRYERFAQHPHKAAQVLHSDAGWESCHFDSTNIQHKVERDWRMAYLARTEDAATASISWSFDFTKDGLRVDRASLEFVTKCYEDGAVDVAIRDGSGNRLSGLTALHGHSRFTITATLTGGRGDVAWQHTQLFRQPLDCDRYPFELRLEFISQ